MGLNEKPSYEKNNVELPNEPIVRECRTRPVSAIKIPSNLEKVDKELYRFDSDHLKRHLDGEVPGSRFEGFKDEKELEEYIKRVLPEKIPYTTYEFKYKDKNGVENVRSETVSEITIDCPRFVGIELAIPKEKFKLHFPKLDFNKIPLSKRELKKGEDRQVDGVNGTWYPKTNMETGEIEKDINGKEITEFAFEPYTKNIEVDAKNLPRTNSMTLVIKKIENKDGSIDHRVVMASPGENIPPIPKRIPFYGVDFDPEQISRFNNKYVFIKEI